MGKLELWKKAILDGDFDVRTEQSCMCSPEWYIDATYELRCKGDASTKYYIGFSLEEGKNNE